VDEDADGAAGLRPEAELVALCGLKHVPTHRGAGFDVRGEPVALFRAGDRVWAVENRNPYTGCDIAGGRMSRVGRTPVVVSPLYQLVFDLRTGACLNAVGLPQQRLRTYAVEVVGDVVHVGPAHVRRQEVAAAGLSV
jgi:nitrite reductase (NADH) small subunit